MGKFDNLLLTADWAKALDTLLEAAAVASDTGEGAQKVQSDLFAFIKASPGKCDFLDDIAAKAANDLFETDVARLIKAIASRKAELQIATKALKGVTEDLEKGESELRFDRIIETLEVSAGLINELKDFSEELDEEDQSLFERAAAIGELVDELRKAIKDYEITEKTLKALGTAKVNEDTIKKLLGITGRKVRGEGRFLELVKKTVGSEEAFTEELQEVILRHAKV